MAATGMDGFCGSEFWVRILHIIPNKFISWDILKIIIEFVHQGAKKLGLGLREMWLKYIHKQAPAACVFSLGVSLYVHVWGRCSSRRRFQDPRRPWCGWHDVFSLTCVIFCRIRANPGLKMWLKQCQTSQFVSRELFSFGHHARSCGFSHFLKSSTSSTAKLEMFLSPG